MKGVLLLLTALVPLVLAEGDEVPEFVPFDKSGLSPASFFEQFDYSSFAESKWHPSKAKKDGTDGDVSYNGRWSIEPPHIYPGFLNDKGLVMKSSAAHHAIYRIFDSPFDNSHNNHLVLQYEVKTQKGLQCGGAYIKLLNADIDFQGFNNKTPFQVMFGPDKCGASDKIHFILTRRNPITGMAEEKRLVDPLESRNTQLSSLYTLVLKNTSDFEIRINGQVVKSGNLLSNPDLLSPSLNPPKEIVDELDIKPEDWDDLEFIADESAQKPEDYDSNYAVSQIPDPKVKKPEGWLDDEPEFILDPFAQKPEEWNEEEDGEWQIPIIKNPKCDFGCGKWEAPLIPNPKYKGPWVQPVMENPNYKGEWKPRTIPNPYYYEETHPTNLELIGGLGFELWSVEPDILFDNIYLGHSVEDAELIGNKTFLPKFELEEKNYVVNRPKPVVPPSPPPKSFDELFEEDTLMVVQVFQFFKLVFKNEFLNMKDFWVQFNGAPLDTLLQDPLKAAVYSGVFVFCFTFVFGIINVVMYMFSGWIQQAKDAINQGAAEARGESNSKQEVPKIVEINDDGEEVNVTSAQVSQTRTGRRKTRG